MLVWFRLVSSGIITNSRNVKSKAVTAKGRTASLTITSTPPRGLRTPEGEEPHTKPSGILRHLSLRRKEIRGWWQVTYVAQFL